MIGGKPAPSRVTCGPSALRGHSVQRAGCSYLARDHLHGARADTARLGNRKHVLAGLQLALNSVLTGPATEQSPLR